MRTARLTNLQLAPLGSAAGGAFLLFCGNVLTLLSISFDLSALRL